mmetsp:Transcript_78375/g.229748  ORF Transcript_78375/g.229748 Transcript_78375/m.229748 type:complete len:273 (-) Transcript_78375:445-1263(-)
MLQPPPTFLLQKLRPDLAVSSGTSLFVSTACCSSRSRSSSTSRSRASTVPASSAPAASSSSRRLRSARRAACDSSSASARSARVSSLCCFAASSCRISAAFRSCLRTSSTEAFELEAFSALAGAASFAAANLATKRCSAASFADGRSLGLFLHSRDIKSRASSSRPAGYLRTALKINRYVASLSTALKGERPVVSSNSSTPMFHMSALSSWPECLSISGGKYSKVPQKVRSLSFCMACAQPKSASFTWSSPSRRMFSGLISRWTTFSGRPWR